MLPPNGRRADMAFTDDLRGLPRAEQIARIQAAARAGGDEMDEAKASQALSLYAETARSSGWPPVALAEADAHRASAAVDTQYAYFLGWRPDLPRRETEREAG